MQCPKIRVGIVGLSADPTHCTNYIHKAPLTSPQLAGKYEIVALSVSPAKDAASAATFHGLQAESGYNDVRSLARDGNVDLVVISVKVPRRFELAMAAISEGKDVYVEWPVASNLAQAEILARQAREKGVGSMVSLPTRLTPHVVKIKNMVENGMLGRVTSTSMVVADDLFLKFHADKRHSHDAANGANIVTIAGGHLLDAVTSVLGELRSIRAQTSMLFPKPILRDEQGNEKRGMTNDAADCFMLHGRLGAAGEIPCSVSMTSQPSTTPNLFQWIITGEKASLKLQGPSLMIHVVPPTLFQSVATADGTQWVEVPLAQDVLAGGAEYSSWATDERQGVVTLADALVRYRMIDAIFRSADSGEITSYEL